MSEPVDPTQLVPTLLWLTTTGMGTWTVIVSDFFRNLKAPWWKEIEKPGTRQFIVTLIQLGVPILAYIILQVVPPDTLEALQPHYKFIASLFSAVLIGRGAFELARRREPPE